MEHTYERRRSSSTAGARRGGHQAMDPRERRRLIQLGVSAGLFLLVFFSRGLLGAEQLADWISKAPSLSSGRLSPRECP